MAEEHRVGRRFVCPTYRPLATCHVFTGLSDYWDPAMMPQPAFNLSGSRKEILGRLRRGKLRPGPAGRRERRVFRPYIVIHPGGRNTYPWRTSPQI